MAGGSVLLLSKFALLLFFVVVVAEENNIVHLGDDHEGLIQPPVNIPERRDAEGYPMQPEVDPETGKPIPHGQSADDADYPDRQQQQQEVIRRLPHVGNDAPVLEERVAYLSPLGKWVGWGSEKLSDGLPLEPRSGLWGLAALLGLLLVAGCCLNFVCRTLLLAPLRGRQRYGSLGASKLRSARRSPFIEENSGASAIERLRVRVTGGQTGLNKKLDAFC